MSKRLQVLVPEDEYAEIQGAARASRMTVAEWVRQAMREARSDRHLSADATGMKLRAVAAASRHEFPTADIDDMLRDIDSGRAAP